MKFGGRSGQVGRACIEVGEGVAAAECECVCWRWVCGRPFVDSCMM